MFIRFEADLKGDIDRLNAEWRRLQREEPGTVMTIEGAEIWGTPIGTTLSRRYPPDFIAFLKAKNFPFTEE